MQIRAQKEKFEQQKEKRRLDRHHRLTCKGAACLSSTNQKELRQDHHPHLNGASDSRCNKCYNMERGIKKPVKTKANSARDRRE
jgi:hypothetical protein